MTFEHGRYIIEPQLYSPIKKIVENKIDFHERLFYPPNFYKLLELKNDLYCVFNSKHKFRSDRIEINFESLFTITEQTDPEEFISWSDLMDKHSFAYQMRHPGEPNNSIDASKNDYNPTNIENTINILGRGFPRIKDHISLYHEFTNSVNIKFARLNKLFDICFYELKLDDGDLKLASISAEHALTIFHDLVYSKMPQVKHIIH